MERAKALFLLLLFLPLVKAAAVITKTEPIDMSDNIAYDCSFVGSNECPSELYEGSADFCYSLTQGPCYFYEVRAEGYDMGGFYACKGCVLSCGVFQGKCYTVDDALALAEVVAKHCKERGETDCFLSGPLTFLHFPEGWVPGAGRENLGEVGGGAQEATQETPQEPSEEGPNTEEPQQGYGEGGPWEGWGAEEEGPSWQELMAQLQQEMEEATPEEALSKLTEVGERVKETLKEILPPLKERFSSPQEVKDYLVETGAVDEETAEVLAKDFSWEEFEEMAEKVGYTPLDEALLMEEQPEVVRQGAREQALRKAVVKEGVEKAQQLKELIAAGAEGYKHNVGTGWSTFMKMLSLLEVASASVVGKMEVVKAAAETLIKDEMDQMRNAYIGEDDLLAKGAKFALQAHQGYAEARATGLGYPPQRFLYGCAKGKYSNFKCKEGEEGGYKVVVNGEERVVSHFVRMKDKDGNIYWVGTDDPEAVDEEALESATIILKEVNGWFWRSDNVEVIDPKSGETLSEEDLPGMFG